MNHQQLNGIIEALKSTFQHKVLDNDLIRISHGAQFSRVGSILGFFVMLLVLLFSIVAMINGAFVAGIILLGVVVDHWLCGRRSRN